MAFFYFLGDFMAQYDGSIRINTEINTSNLNSQTMRVNESLRRLEGEATRLRDRLRELETTEVPTEEYADLSNQLARAQNRLDQLVQRQQRMQAEGRNSGAAWGRINRQIEVARNEVGAVETQMQELVDSGRAFRLGSDTDEYQRTSEQLRRVEADIEINNRRLQEMRNGQNSAADGFEEMEESSDKSLKNVDSGLQRIIKSIKKFVGIIGTAFAVGKIIQFGKESLEVASDFEAMEAQFSQVFGELESTASESLSEVAGQAGIMEDRMKASFTKIAAFAKTTGMNTADSLALSERAMIAVADSAAFYDRSLEETTEYLQSFLKGNYENDAALGLSATEYTRNAAAMKLYGKSFIELSEAQKQLTLLQMVEDANMLSGAMGQAAREADTWTNQVGNLKQAWTTLMASIGKIILPAAIQAVKFITNVINSLNAMIARLSVAAGAFRSFSELLTGNKSSAGSGAGNVASSGGISENTADGYNAAADAAENLAGSTEKAAKATKDAKKAAEGYLNPLDEINKFSKKEEVSNPEEPGVGIGNISGIENIDYGKVAEGENVLDKVSESASGLIGKLKELAGIFKQGFFDGLGDWEYRWDSIKDSISSIKESLKDIFTAPEVISAADSYVESVAYMLGSLVGATASIGLTIATNLIGGIAKYLEENKERIKNHLVSMFNIWEEVNYMLSDFFQSFAYVFEAFASEDGQRLTANLIGIFTDAFMGVAELASKLIRDVLNIFIQPFVDNKEGFRTALEGFLSVLADVAGTIKDAVDDTFDKLNQVYDEHFKPFFDSVANGLSDLVKRFLDFWNGKVQPILSQMAKDFDELWKTHIQPLINNFIELLGKVADMLKVMWENISSFIAWIIDNVLPKILPVIQAIWDVLVDFVAYIADMINAIITIIGGVIDFLTGIFSGDWELAFQGLQSVVSGFVEAINATIAEIVEIGKNIILGLMEGISAAMSGIFRWIKGIIVDPIVNAFKSLFGIHSPSTVMAEMGRYIIEGLLNGIKSLVPNVQEIWEGMKEAAVNIWNSMKDSLADTWESIKQTAVNTWENIKRNLSEKWENLKTGVKETFETIKSRIEESWAEVKENVKNSAENVKMSISDAWTKAKETTSEVWGNIKERAVSSAQSMASSIREKFGTLQGAVRSFSSSAQSIWGSAWEGMKSKVSTILNSIQNTITSVFSWISRTISSLGSSLRNLVSSVFSFGSTKTTISGHTSGRYSKIASPASLYASPVLESLSTMPIPHLATGAVIPANKEFLAVLGDQKHGTNIEAPLDTIKQASAEAVIEVLSKLGITGNIGNSNPQTIIIKQYLDGKQVAESVVKEGKVRQMSTGSNMFLLGTT